MESLSVTKFRHKNSAKLKTEPKLQTLSVFVSRTWLGVIKSLKFKQAVNSKLAKYIVQMFQGIFLL